MCSLLVVSGLIAWAENPPIDPPPPPEEGCEEGEGGCDGPGDPCATKTGSHYEYPGSFHWKLNTGKTRFSTTTALIDLARQAGNEPASPVINGWTPKGVVVQQISNKLQAAPGGTQGSQISGSLDGAPTIEQVVRRAFNPRGAISVFLKINRPLIDASLYTPQVLEPLPISNAIVLTKTDAGYSYIGQILTDDALTDISVLNAWSWRVRIWNRAQVDPSPVGGFYPIPGTSVLPLNDFTFSNPDYPMSSGRLQFTNTVLLGDVPTSSTVLYATSGNTLTRNEYEGTTIDVAHLLHQTVTTKSAAGPKAWDYTLVREDSSISSALGVSGSLQVIRRTKEVYEDFSIGAAGGEVGFERLVQQIEGFASDAPLTTTRTYYSDPTNPFVHGRLKSLARPDGYWEFYKYTDSPGATVRTTTKYSAWLDLPPLTAVPPAPPAAPYAGLKETTTITAGSAETITTVGSELIAKRRNVMTPPANSGDFSTITFENFDGTEWHTRKERFYAQNHPNVLFRSRPASVVYADGTGETWTHEASPTFARREIRRRGACTVTGNVVEVTSGTETIADYNIQNIPVFVETWDIASLQKLDEWLAVSFDLRGLPTRINYLSGAFELREYACCGLSSLTTKDKIVTTYDRDKLKRVWRAITTYPNGGGTVQDTTAFNGLTTAITRASGAVSFLRSERTSHLNGALLQTKSADANGDNIPEQTSYANLNAAGGGWLQTVTYPDTSTAITETFRDGRTKSMSGSAVADTAFTYGLHPTLTFGTYKGLMTRRTALTATGGTNEWREETTDPLGRRMNISFPSATAPHSALFYAASAAAGSRGKMQSSTDADGVTQSYGYNSEGQQISTTTPHPGPGGSRVTGSTTDVLDTVTLKGVTIAPAIRTTTTINSIPISVSYRSGDSLQSGSSSFGRDTVSTRTIADTAGAWTVTAILPDGTKTVSSITKGGLERMDSYQNTASTVIASTGSVRDPLGRQVSTADSRTGATLYSGHSPAGQARTVTQPGAHITSLTFDVMGRNLTADSPDSPLSSNVGGGTSTNITRTSYYPTGQIKAQWGAQTNAAFCLYDEQNRMVNLRTYRALAVGVEPLVGTTGFDLTTWNYDSNRGFLLSKRDVSNLGANYTYTNAGRLRTRQWARGLWTRYDYHAASGMRTAIRHFVVGTPAGTVLTAASGNDAATPDSDFTFDLHGRADTASTFTGVAPNRIEFTRNQSYYTANFTLDKEDIMVDPDGAGPIPPLTRTLDRREDTLLRSTGWDLKNGAAIDHANTYAYQPVDGRLNTVTGSASTFTYGYTLNSANLIANVAGPAHTVTNTWLPDRDGLDLKQNKVGTTNLSTYDYGVNAISQRESVATSGTAFGASATTGWGYDGLGQVVSADHPTAAKDFGYSYDQMGNRQRSSRNTFNPSTATGTNLAIYRSTTTAGSTPGGNGLNQYGLLELYGATAENNTYDTDGNQINGRYATSTQTPGTRTWDGENRLVTAVVNTGYPSTSLYTYDAYHRRVAKRTTQLQPSPPGYSLSTTHTLYDGWNPVADYNYSTGHTLKSSYTWGKDLSGSLQDAGGVGGLLSVQSHAPASNPGTYYPTYDGNGNISEYLTTTGAIAAHYEYGPFGEALTTTGPQAYLFSHRFSTKPLDGETGYYYYGYRFYDSLSGRWPNRDPIGEQGGLNLYAMVWNSQINSIDLLGLSESIDTRNSPNCPCKQEDIDKKGAEYSKQAADSTRDFAMPKDIFTSEEWRAEKPEFGGNICCDEKTGEVTATGPSQGKFKKQAEPWENGKYIYEGGLFDSKTAPPCPKGTKTVAVYHSHPDGSGFSKMGPEGIQGKEDSDEKWVDQNVIPLFLGNQSGKLLRLDLSRPFTPGQGYGARKFTTTPVFP